MKKATKRNAARPPFTGYSDDDWRKIEAMGAYRALPVRTLESYRDMLEKCFRNLAALPTDLDQLSFSAKENLTRKFRCEVIEEGQLPPELRQGAAEWVTKIERYYQDRTCVSAANLWRRIQAYKSRILGVEGAMPIERPPPSQNAERADLDSCFIIVSLVWMGIGGDYWSRSLNTKACRNFIAACARPVVEPKYLSDRAIKERLHSLIGFMNITPIECVAARLRYAEFVQKKACKKVLPAGRRDPRAENTEGRSIAGRKRKLIGLRPENS